MSMPPHHGPPRGSGSTPATDPVEESGAGPEVEPDEDCRMRRTLLFLTLLLAAWPAISLGAQPRPTSFELVAEDGTRKVLAAAELAALPQIEVPSTTRDGRPIVLRGPTLRTLLDLVAAPAGGELRGVRLNLVVTAEAYDGYRVTFSLAELDPAFGGKTAILALTQDGAPLPGADGPYRLALPGEEHFSRWVRQVARLRVRMLGP